MSSVLLRRIQSGNLKGAKEYLDDHIDKVKIDILDSRGNNLLMASVAADKFLRKKGKDIGFIDLILDTIEKDEFKNKFDFTHSNYDEENILTLLYKYGFDNYIDDILNRLPKKRTNIKLISKLLEKSKNTDIEGKLKDKIQEYANLPEEKPKIINRDDILNKKYDKDIKFDTDPTFLEYYEIINLDTPQAKHFNSYCLEIVKDFLRNPDYLSHITDPEDSRSKKNLFDINEDDVVFLISDANTMNAAFLHKDEVNKFVYSLADKEKSKNSKHVIFVTKLLLDAIRNKDQLYGILAHEMTHLIKSDEMGNKANSNGEEGLADTNSILLSYNAGMNVTEIVDFYKQINKENRDDFSIYLSTKDEHLSWFTSITHLEAVVAELNTVKRDVYTIKEHPFENGEKEYWLSGKHLNFLDVEFEKRKFYEKNAEEQMNIMLELYPYMEKGADTRWVPHDGETTSSVDFFNFERKDNVREIRWKEEVYKRTKEAEYWPNYIINEFNQKINEYHKKKAEEREGKLQEERKKLQEERKKLQEEQEEQEEKKISAIKRECSDEEYETAIKKAKEISDSLINLQEEVINDEYLEWDYEKLGFEDAYNKLKGLFLINNLSDIIMSANNISNNDYPLESSDILNLTEEEESCVLNLNFDKDFIINKVSEDKLNVWFYVIKNLKEEYSKIFTYLSIQDSGSFSKKEIEKIEEKEIEHFMKVNKAFKYLIRQIDDKEKNKEKRNIIRVFFEDALLKTNSENYNHYNYDEGYYWSYLGESTADMVLLNRIITEADHHILFRNSGFEAEIPELYFDINLIKRLSFLNDVDSSVFAKDFHNYILNELPDIINRKKGGLLYKIRKKYNYEVTDDFEEFYNTLLTIYGLEDKYFNTIFKRIETYLFLKNNPDVSIDLNKLHDICNLDRKDDSWWSSDDLLTDVGFKSSINLHEVLSSFIQNSDNWPEDSDNILKLYEKLNKSGYMPPESEIEYQILSRNIDLGIEESDGYHFLLKYLNKENRLEYPALRKKVFDTIVDRVLKLVDYKEDDNSEEYYNIIANTWDEISKDIISLDKHELARELSLRIKSQKKLSYKLQPIDSLSNKTFEQSNSLGIQIEQTIAVLDEMPDIAGKFIEILTNPYNQDLNKNLRYELKARRRQNKNLIVFSRSLFPVNLLLSKIPFSDNNDIRAYDNRIDTHFSDKSIRKLYENFWNSPLKARVAFLKRIYEAENGYYVKDWKRLSKTFDTPEWNDYLYDLSKRSNSRSSIWVYILKDILNKKIDSLDGVDYKDAYNVLHSFIKAKGKEERSFYPCLMMVVNHPNDVVNKKLNLGQILSMLADLGPAEKKFVQAVHSSKQTPENIRREIDTVKSQKNNMDRWEVWNLLEAHYPFVDEIEKILDVFEASYMLTVEAIMKDGSKKAIKILNPNYISKASNGFDEIDKSFKYLNKTSTKDLVPLMQQMVNNAKNNIYCETDFSYGYQQYKKAHEIYENLEMKIADYKVKFDTAEWIRYGKNFAEMKYMNGKTFDELEEDNDKDKKYKNIIAKAHVLIELIQILKGKEFDYDRHVKQQNIVLDEKNNTIHIGLYDHGSLILEKKTDEELFAAGEMFGSVIQSVINHNDPMDSFNGSLEKLHKKYDELPQYIIEIEKALLAMSDFMNYLTDENWKEIIAAAISKAPLNKKIKEGIFSVVNDEIKKAINYAGKTPFKFLPTGDIKNIKKKKSKELVNAQKWYIENDKFIGATSNFKIEIDKDEKDKDKDEEDKDLNNGNIPTISRDKYIEQLIERLK